MADLSQTAANVAIGAATLITQTKQAGEAMTQGMPCYLKTSDNKWYKCDANDTVAKALCGGIVLTPVAGDGYFMMAIPGTTPGKALVNLGATLAVGTYYGVSASVGLICPISDISTGQYPTGIGFATTTTLLDFMVTAPSTAKA